MSVGFNRAVWDGTAAMVAPATGARTIGSLALLEVGCSLWSKSRRDHRDDAIGGIVIAVESRADQETGEIVRTFALLDTYRPVITLRTLTEAEVDLATAEGPDQGRLRKALRRIAYELGTGKGPLTTQDLDRVRWLYTLAGIVVPR